MNRVRVDFVIILMEEMITGIQQCGIGTHNAQEAALYYSDFLGMNSLVFDDTADAALMQRYTGNKIYRRRAMLTMNLHGGGGLELWQFKNRQPQPPSFIIQPGDTGIYAIKIKCADVAKAHRFFLAKKDCHVSALLTNPLNEQHFWLRDKYGALFNMVKAAEIFGSQQSVCAGVCGAVIGVSHMGTSLPFYKQFLGISTEAYNVQQGDFGPDPTAGNRVHHTVLLQKEPSPSGAFCRLLGGIEIELVETKDYHPKKIFGGRYWGDPGFIHLCFDVLNMDALEKRAADLQYTFTVDSKNSFSMEKARGRFCYVEDPDGTLIELVETHAVPIVKKWGWYLNLAKSKHKNPLPSWMIRMMGLSKVK